MKDWTGDRPLGILRAVASAMAEDVLLLPDEELSLELRDEGLDVAQTASEMRAHAMEQIAEFRRKRLFEARVALAKRVSRSRPTIRPALGVVRERIKEVFTRHTELSVAFRNRQKLSDADWMSTWDDMVELGLISDEDESAD